MKKIIVSMLALCIFGIFPHLSSATVTVSGTATVIIVSIGPLKVARLHCVPSKEICCSMSYMSASNSTDTYVNQVVALSIPSKGIQIQGLLISSDIQSTSDGTNATFQIDTTPQSK